VIRFDLPSTGEVHLTVFDVTGRPVRRLVDGARYEAGQQHVTWDGRSDQGASVASGVYFYRIETNGFRATKRMTLLK
jgi:flagellar hook assembly protein FlgD